MGAIVAYTNDPDEDKARRDGLAELGRLLIANTGPGAANKAAGVKKALEDAKNISQLDLRFQTQSISALAGPKGYIINVPVSVAASKIVCSLTNDLGQPVGTLTLDAIRDPNKIGGGGGGAANDKYEMHVVFPESVDDTGYPYLNQVAIDALDIEKTGGTISNVKHYLAAFKFLSRCK